MAAAQAHAQGWRSLDSERYAVAEILAQLDRRIEALEPGCGVSTERWFAELPAPEAQVGLFLALLELARLQRILLGQSREFGPVMLKRLAYHGRAQGRRARRPSLFLQGRSEKR